MSNIEGIHPELRLEDIPENKLSPEEVSGVVKESRNVISFEEARKALKPKETEAEKQSVLLDEYKKLRKAVSCGINEKPSWCVYGTDVDGDRGLLYWIRPDAQDESHARRIAELISKLGGYATAEKTEWNPSLKGKPIYKGEESFEFILGDQT